MPESTAVPAVVVLRNMKLVPAVLKSARIVRNYVRNVVCALPVSMGKKSTVRTVALAVTPRPCYV